MRAGIAGMGAYAPEKIYDNAYMESIVETNNEWIMQRTGIAERHIAAENEYTSDLATEAAKRAIKDAGIDPSEIELIIVATVTPDYFSPSVACLVQKNIGAENAAAFDMNAACSGFVTALVTAEKFIATGTYKTVLVIGADALSKGTDYKDRATCILFGDAAGAAIVKATDEGGILSSWIGARGADFDKITNLAFKDDPAELEKRISGNKNTFWMAGSEVMKFAVRIMAEATENVVEKAGLSMSDIKLVVPHQANLRIIEGAAKRLDIDSDRVFVNLQKYGNTSAASIPVALCEAVEDGKFQKGDKIVIVGFGAGLTWGAALIEW
ncbi:MAG: ketoacyl-ACP synthase III [Clostridia bacterium]|nr:ketoacyl-ACP synthase III [Clostridia bacterium]